MRAGLFLALNVVACTAALGQEAVLEVRGVFGECAPILASTSDRLVLYERPDLRSPTREVAYRENWRVVFSKKDGFTRVLRLGTLTVIKPEVLARCEPAPENGSLDLQVGEEVRYLYYLGEGFGRIAVHGFECDSPVHPKLGVFETVETPEVQSWLRVLHADGSSPGWLLDDGKQVRPLGVEC